MSIYKNTVRFAIATRTETGQRLLMPCSRMYAKGLIKGSCTQRVRRLPSGERNIVLFNGCTVVMRFNNH